MKGLHLSCAQDAWGHVVAKLLRQLPARVAAAELLVEKARVLDNFYVPLLYPNGHPAGAPFEHTGRCRARRLSGMPVRLSSTAVLAWPDAQVAAEAAQRWAEELRRAEVGVVAVGYFGSYTRGDWGVGSDLDVVVIVDDSPEPFQRRADATRLPVPADVLVYTRAEWERLSARPREVVWVSGHPS